MRTNDLAPILRRHSSDTNLLLMPNGYVYLQYNNTWYVSDKKYLNLDVEGQRVKIFYSPVHRYKLFAQSDYGLELIFEPLPAVQIEILKVFGQ
jgi:hypothetical protein